LYIDNRFCLRSISNSKVEADQCWDNIYSDPHVNKFLDVGSMPLTKDETFFVMKQNANDVNNKLSYRWVIYDSLLREVIGEVGFYDNNVFFKRIEIFYHLSSKLWGKGIMTKACYKAINYIFENTNIKRIQANILLHNEKSVKLINRLGFEWEGTLKSYRYMHGRLIDVHMFGLINKN
jgi:ribosomal-protein-alanine N-acetyltransferase